MITVRASGERVHISHGTHEIWHSFGVRGRTQPVEGFGALSLFDEESLPPGATATALLIEAEVLYYICDGSLTFRDGMTDVVLVAGTFLHQASSRHLQQRLRNASTSAGARLFRIGLRPSGTARPLGVQSRRIGVGQRRGELRLVASADGHDGSLPVTRDLSVYSAVLPAGHHVASEVGEGRSAWLHVVTGRGRLGELELGPGDGVGLVDEPRFGFTATEKTEVLVIDVRS